jgi:D-serine deaminase-like pyridoxal phosphate-dependent protein
MAAGGIPDILVGYPIVGESKLARLVRLAAHTNIEVCLDSLVVAEAIENAARVHGVRIRILVEIDTGLHRTGVEPGGVAVKLAEDVSRLNNLVFAGFLTHEGHVYSSAHTDEDLRAHTASACAAVVGTAELARRRGLEFDVVSVGSAATFRHAIAQPGITEVRPGTYVFNDLTQIRHGAATENEVAAIVATTVVSRSRATEVVIDAGSKSLTSDLQIFPDSPRTFGRVAGRPDWTVVRLSEEHGVVSVPADVDLAIGERLAIIPNHICPVVNLYDAATLLMEDGSTTRWLVAARGKSQ